MEYPSTVVGISRDPEGVELQKQENKVFIGRTGCEAN